MDSPVYDAIVVGMGPSGTMCASTLARAGKRVLALEAQDRIGGRVKTVPFGDGVVELGAEWIHGTEHSSVYEMAIQNNVSIIPQDLKFKAYRSDGSEGDSAVVDDLLTFCLGVVDDPPKEPEPLGQYITRRVRAYIAEKYPQLSNDTDFVENFLKFMDLVIDNYESSNSWNDVSTMSAYEELGGNQHMSWHTNGYKTLFDIILNKYNNGPGLPTLTIKLNTEVVQIKWPKDTTGLVEVTTKDGAVYKAEHVIVTVSLGVLKERQSTIFSPLLPDVKSSAIKNISYGVVDKVTFRFPTKVCEKKFCAFIWKTEDLEEDLVTQFEGVSIPMSCGYCLTAWFNGNYAKHAALFLPPLPQEKVKLIEIMSIGIVDKIVFRFDEAWWPKTSNFYSFIWKTQDRITAEDKWITNIFGASNPTGNGRVVTVWTSGDGAKLVESLPDDVVQSKVMTVIRKFMGANVTVPEPIEMIRSSWFSNPFTRGSYSYDNTLSPTFPDARKELGQPLLDSSGAPRVLFAGEATDPIHFSTVHGAVDAGKREANRLLRVQSKI